MPPKKKPKKKQNPFKQPWLVAMGADVASVIVNLARLSWRTTSVAMPEETRTLIESGGPVIYALWHGRMYCLFKAVPMQETAVLVSPSHDGDFITRIARRAGFRHFVRGSQKRGKLQAIRGLQQTLVEDRRSIAFTVDGPRGPRYVVKPGIIRLASQTGVPIIPLGSATRWLLAKLDKSWDHYHAPQFFTPVALRYGAPMRIPLDADEETVSTYARRLEEELMRLNQEADAFYHLKNRL